VRVLIDECVPRQLKNWLAEAHDVTTVFDAGWSGMKNGALLREANQRFDVLITADQNLYHQQSFAGLTISISVLPTNRLRLVRNTVPALLQSLRKLRPNQRIVIDLGADTVRWPELKLNRIVEESDLTRHVFGLWSSADSPQHFKRYRGDARLPEQSILTLVRTALFDPVYRSRSPRERTRVRRDPQAPAAVVYAGRFADLQRADAALYGYAARSGLVNAMERVSRFWPARMGHRFALRRLVATRGINGSPGIVVPFRALKTVDGGSKEASFELPARPQSAILVRQNDQKEQLHDAGYRVQGALPRTDGSCRGLGRDDYDNETRETRSTARSSRTKIHVLLRLLTGNGRR
jgi:predicted nuclease of predicted toxin-antitoxin system